MKSSTNYIRGLMYDLIVGSVSIINVGPLYLGMDIQNRDIILMCFFFDDYEAYFSISVLIFVGSLFYCILGWLFLGYICLKNFFPALSFSYNVYLCC